MEDKYERQNYHPAIHRAVQRHQEFFEGKRDYLIKIEMPIEGDLEKEISFDEVDWERNFDEYVRGRVANGVTKARIRMGLGLDDDYIPVYFPYFGISIHHSFFGGKVKFGGGTSYAGPVISNADDWNNLHYDLDCPWIQKLIKGMAYCRDNGEGVLTASFRGGNGPLDMANGIMGNSFFTEIYDNPDGMDKVMEICYQSILGTFGLQRKSCTEIDGGHIVSMGSVWIPGNTIGHISLDAACLVGPNAFERFERPFLDRLAETTGGFFIHTHMLGWRFFKEMCRAKGILVFAPTDDPNQPKVIDKIDSVLNSVGTIPLLISVPAERFDEVLPKFNGRRAIFNLLAKDRNDAMRQMELVDHYCCLER
jgi:hypothetical protein